MAKRPLRLLLVDGYNVLRSGSRYKNIEMPDYTDDYFNRARDQLINDVIGFAGRDMQAVIVFDGGDNMFSTGEMEKIGEVRIVFSPAGQSADKVIEKLAHDAKARGMEALVVTSDASIQDTVFGGGVDRMSAEEFCRAMRRYDREVVLDKSPEVAIKNTISERIDAKTLAKLKALRDQR